MTGVGWQRWVLGLLVAGLIPITIGGAGCGGKDFSPEPTAGKPSTSGSANGGSASGGGASGSSASGGGASGTAAGGNDYAGSGGFAGVAGASGGAGGHGGRQGGEGGATPECCFGAGLPPPHCSEDGQLLRTCTPDPSASVCGFYGSVWKVQACTDGCGSGGQAGAHCK